MLSKKRYTFAHNIYLGPPQQKSSGMKGVPNATTRRTDSREFSGDACRLGSLFLALGFDVEGFPCGAVDAMQQDNALPAAWSSG